MIGRKHQTTAAAGRPVVGRRDSGELESAAVSMFSLGPDRSQNQPDIGKLMELSIEDEIFPGRKRNHSHSSMWSSADISSPQEGIPDQNTAHSPRLVPLAPIEPASTKLTMQRGYSQFGFGDEALFTGNSQLLDITATASMYPFMLDEVKLKLLVINSLRSKIIMKLQMWQNNKTLGLPFLVRCLGIRWEASRD